MSTLDLAHTAARRPSALALAGWLSALGAASVVTTGVFYVLSPRPAAGPMQPLDIDAAMAGAVSGAPTLHIAGTVGIFGDVLWAAAALLLAGELTRRGRPMSALGWHGLFLSILIFTFVDGLTGFVMSPLAASHDVAAYAGFKRLWDMLFLLGVVTYSGGAVLALLGDVTSERPMIARALCWAGVATALVGGAGAIAGFLGFGADQIAGASILIGPLLFIPISLQMAKA
jgi:hypothetical protein